MHNITHSYPRTLVLLLAGILFTPTTVPAQTEQPENFVVQGVSDLVRVFQDGFPERSTDPAIETFGIRGETVSAQAVIKTTVRLDAATASLSPFMHTTSSYTFPDDALKWNYVGNIPLTENAPKQRASAVVRQAPAQFPDYLAPERKRTIKAGQQQAIWLTIEIPRNAPAGRYTGTLRVEAGEDIQALPIHLRVYDFALPQERHLNITEWFSLTNLTRFEMVDSLYSDAYFEMLHRYARNMREHRQNVFRLDMVPYIEITRTEQGDFAFDFSLFDRIAEVFWETRRLTCRLCIHASSTG